MSEVSVTDEVGVDMPLKAQDETVDFPCLVNTISDLEIGDKVPVELHEVLFKLSPELRSRPALPLSFTEKLM